MPQCVKPPIYRYSRNIVTKYLQYTRENKMRIQTIIKLPVLAAFITASVVFSNKLLQNMIEMGERNSFGIS